MSATFGRLNDQKVTRSARPPHSTEASLPTPSAIRSGGSPANVSRRNGLRRFPDEPTAAGGDDHARGRGAAGKRHVVGAVRKPRPEVQAPAGHARRARAGGLRASAASSAVAALAQPRAQARRCVRQAAEATSSSAACCSGPETKKSSTRRAARSRAPAAPRAAIAAIRRPGAARLGQRAQVDDVAVGVVGGQRRRRRRRRCRGRAPSRPRSGTPGRADGLACTAARRCGASVAPCGLAYERLAVEQPGAGAGERLGEQVRAHAVRVGRYRHRAQPGRARRGERAAGRSATRRAPASPGAPSARKVVAERGLPARADRPRRAARRRAAGLPGEPGAQLRAGPRPGRVPGAGAPGGPGQRGAERGDRLQAGARGSRWRARWRPARGRRAARRVRLRRARGGPSATSCQERSGARRARLRRARRTKVPRPGRGLDARPRRRAAAIARCTVTGEARWRAISSRTDGRRLPGAAALGPSRRTASDNAIAGVIVSHEQPRVTLLPARR